jgi:hypothetical protein
VATVVGMDEINGENYDHAPVRLLNAADQSVGQQAPAETQAAIAIGMASLSINERLAAIEFQLSQMPRG